MGRAYKMQNVYWDTLSKAIDIYFQEAEKCLQAGCHIAGIACIRAALEAALLARYLTEIFDWSSEELAAYGIRLEKERGLIQEIEIEDLSTFIAQAFKDRLITQTGKKAADRIRLWGNKIHPTKLVANKKTMPKITDRNLKARITDFSLIAGQLSRTL